MLDTVMMGSKVRSPEKPDRIVVKIMAKRGLPSIIARACGIAPQAVYQWKRVPPHWVQIVAAIIKMRPEEIRPDIFRSRK